MKIKITTDRKPWANGKPAQKGETVEVSSEEATILLQAGFAEAVGGPEPKRARTRQLKKDDSTLTLMKLGRWQSTKEKES